jgi:hypothetical protein
VGLPTDETIHLTSGGDPLPASDIPVGTQFSPNVLDFRALLKLAIDKDGDRAELERLVSEAPVRIKNPGKKMDRRMRQLPWEAAAAYGLLEETTWKPRPIVHELVALPDSEMYPRFAKHILLNCRGVEFVRGVQAFLKEARAAGGKINADLISQYFRNHGLHVVEHNTAINSMRMWLSKGGVYPWKGSTMWDANDDVVTALVGLNMDEIAAISSWSREHIELAKALCRMNPKGEVKAADVRASAETMLPYTLSRASNRILFKPLLEAGYVAMKTGGTAEGKSAKVAVTDRFRADVLAPFLENAHKMLGNALFRLYDWDPERIRKGLESSKTSEKGMALEAYAVRVMRLMNLRFVTWRLRSSATGGAEVDATFTGLLGGVPTRWQVQCKNTKTEVRLDDVAKEVGLVPLTKATHILVLSNQKFTRAAVTFARDTMRESPVTLFLVGGDDFRRVLDDGGAALLSVIRRQSEDALELHQSGDEASE